MKIGIDIDNTITNTLPILKQYCKRYNEEVVKRNLEMKEEGFSSCNLYEWTEKENIDFCKDYIEEIVLQAKLKENAMEVIRKLKDENNEIYIISARRKPEFKEPYSLTEKFLKDNGIVYDKLIVNCTEKDEFCIQNDIDIMIDDEPQNINLISKTRPVIAFEMIYNKKCEGNNIIKINNWNEIYNIIKKLERKMKK